MEATQTNRQGTSGEKDRFRHGRKVYRFFKKIVTFAVWFLFHVFIATLRYSTITAIAILVILGALSTYDFLVEDKVPPIRPLTIYDPERYLAHNNFTRHIAASPELFFKEEECWEGLQMPLQILDKVCPEASAWVRDRHEKGKIVWERKSSGTYAKYDYINKVLTFNRISFLEDSGTKAVILAHEFRHSRQKLSKFYRHTVACMICGGPKPEVVENDAYLFEKRIQIAIFLGRTDL